MVAIGNRRRINIYPIQLNTEYDSVRSITDDHDETYKHERESGSESSESEVEDNYINYEE